MLVLVLAPSASRAAVAFGSGPWSSVCSTAEPLAAAPHGGGPAALHVDHCPLCSHAGMLPLPAPGASGIAVPAGAQALPRFERAAPRARTAALAARPRGPPAHA